MKKNVRHSVKALCAAVACMGLLFAFFTGCDNLAGGGKQGPVPSSAKQLTGFKFEAEKNGLTADITGEIDEFLKTVSLKVPQGTDITKLKASFTVSDKAQVSVRTVDKGEVQNTVQISGETENDFKLLVFYTVKAEDGSSQVYSVQVDVPSASGKFTGKRIPAFGFSKAMNPALSEDVTGFVTYSGKTGQRFIYLKFPVGTTEETLKNLKPVFTASTNAGISVKNKEGTYVELKSGVTAADFYTPGTKTLVPMGGAPLPQHGTDIKVMPEDGGEALVYSVQVEIDLPNAPESEVSKYFGSYYGELNSPYLGNNKVIIVLEKEKVILYTNAKGMSMDYVNVEWEKDGSEYTCIAYSIKDTKNLRIKNVYGKLGFEFEETWPTIKTKVTIMGIPVTAEKGDDFVWTEGCGYSKVSMHP